MEIVIGGVIIAIALYFYGSQLSTATPVSTGNAAAAVPATAVASSDTAPALQAPPIQILTQGGSPSEPSPPTTSIAAPPPVQTSGVASAPPISQPPPVPGPIQPHPAYVSPPSIIKTTYYAK